MAAVRKQRIDKYYNLAKEKGYRARSAFKLLELNRKFSFLRNAKIAVDLCAAPGGWLQILSQEMPPVRKIIGVDLDPIKPLGGDVTTFVGDITTVECRRTLIGLLDGHMVDVFVHDGAPNFGAAKERDVFVQNDLVLSALKLACEFLAEKGTFVTKIFRSENFTKIIAVLEELFGSVDVTKPLSSRAESAEVFAVCRAYKAPGYINPGFFDSNVLFREETLDGEEDDYRKIKLTEYVLSQDDRILERCLTVIPDFESDLVTPEVREMLRDVKLLGLKELKTLRKLKREMRKKAENGEMDHVPALSVLKKADKYMRKEDTVCKTKLDRLRAEIERAAEESEDEEERMVCEEIPKFDIFDGRIFRDFGSTESAGSMGNGDDLNEDEEEEEDKAMAEVSVSSCSESMEMTESEMRCAIEMKEKGEEAFAEDTIDRHLVDSEDVVLPFEKRPVKMDESRVERKKAEFLSRKRARALRRAKKVMSEIEVEYEEEEAIIHKNVVKNLFKKEKSKPRLVFPTKGGRKPIIPKGRGKIKFLDRRMEHDLRIEKRRARQRR